MHVASRDVLGSFPKHKPPRGSRRADSCCYENAMYLLVTPVVEFDREVQVVGWRNEVLYDDFGELEVLARRFRSEVPKKLVLLCKSRCESEVY